MISTVLMVMFHKIGQLDYLWDVIVNSHFNIRIFKIAGLYQALKHKNHISANYQSKNQTY